MHLGGKALFVRQGRAVFGGENFAGQPFESVVGHGRILFGAQDKADGRVLASKRPVLARVVQVQVHLPGVGVGELA